MECGVRFRLRIKSDVTIVVDSKLYPTPHVRETFAVEQGLYLLKGCVLRYVSEDEDTPLQVGTDLQG